MHRQRVFSIGDRGFGSPLWMNYSQKGCTRRKMYGFLPRIHFLSTPLFYLLLSCPQALLSGCSAGGLASILHCDKFRDLLPATTKVKCFSDAGFFIDA
ncbi:hypothetical protein KSP40_PGU016882 [Platanthera guangdongensis]|uniref:Pectin acetylesterase n=1 Tax=Platanthera guangdongensis TaxID=2320717 RepID=A0ABR2LFP1_9ASPA